MPKGSGISNRQDPEKEAEERERLPRPPDVARDRAGHIVREEPGEAIEAEQDRAQKEAPNDESPRGRRIRQSR